MDETSLKKLNDLPHGQVVFLCDFDGTITETETVGFLFREFAESKYEYARQWARGEIDMREEFRETFKTVSATKEEMESALDIVEVDPDFIEFLSTGKEKGYTFAVVSDGLEWSIRYILNRHGINDLDVYANRIFFESSGFRFEFPWFDEETKRRGVCKPKIARAYRKNFDTLVFVGDGRSDIDIVNEADFVFAKGWLAGYCFAKGNSGVEFFDWNDLKIRWKDAEKNFM